MGHIKHIKSNLDPQAFPGAHFETAGTVPQSQCSEARIENTGAETTHAPQGISDPGKFVGEALDGKICHILESTGGNTGDFTVAETTDDFLFLTTSPGNGTNVSYYISDGAGLIITRDTQSFAEFIHAAGYAFTVKAGKLYTDMPSDQLKDACSILFDPLT